MKTLMLMAALMLLTGCGREPGTYDGFEDYVELFKHEAITRGVHVDFRGIDIRFDPSLDAADSDIIGRCYISTGRIVLSKDYWDRYPAGRETLIFHEFGHCLLDKGHGECPGVMCEYDDTRGYWQNRTKFVDDLFFK